LRRRPQIRSIFAAILVGVAVLISVFDLIHAQAARNLALRRKQTLQIIRAKARATQQQAADAAEARRNASGAAVGITAVSSLLMARL
jgi:hypothetical protein